MHTKNKKVMIMISRADTFGDNFTRGIIEYSKLYGNWNLTTQLPSYLENQASQNKTIVLKDAGFDGAIAYIPNPEKAGQVSFRGLPAIIAHATEESELYNLPYIVCDNFAIGKMATDFFIGRGFKNMAFYGFKDFLWSKQREESFIKANLALKINTHTYLTSPDTFTQNTSKEKTKVANWLKKLPKPISILAANDDLGIRLVQICQENGLKVPLEVAILGIDNDEIECNLTTPSLSSISYNSKNAGFQAAQMLDELMNGKKAKQRIIFITPIEVINRQSTNIFATSDADILKALDYIKNNSRHILQVEDIASVVGMSRRNLGRKFKTTLGISIHNIIKQTRTEDICHMLTDTDLPITQIAKNLGFADASHISRYFKVQTGTSPADYRKKYSIKASHIV
ncbi:MAG: DNA-binding transcriptional regulator [Phycisphaerales bacterium]